ncbi:MAG: glycosyltransferase family 39 protein, partial [Microgenomates group bacterium]
GFFGDWEISLRMPSVLFSLGTGYFVYRIGRLLGNKQKGMWAMIFFLFNPLSIYYSQEARMYMMATFLGTLTFFFFIKMQKVKSKIDLILFNLFIVLSFYTFYGIIFLIVFYWIYFLWKKKYQEFFYSILIFIFSFLIISPLLYQQWMNSKISLSEVKNWSLVLGKANLKNLILIPLKFSVGRISFYPKWLYYLIAGSWVMFLIILNIKNFKNMIKNKNIELLYLLVILPILFGFGISFFTPLLSYFRFLYLLPIFCILLSFAINTTVLRSIVVIGFGIFSAFYLLNTDFHREDWRSLAKSIPKNLPLFMILSSSDSLKYYNHNLKIFSLNNLSKSNYKKIIVIPYTAEIWGINYQKILKEKQYFIQKKVDFRGVFYEIYQK